MKRPSEYSLVGKRDFIKLHRLWFYLLHPKDFESPYPSTCKPEFSFLQLLQITVCESKSLPSCWTKNELRRTGYCASSCIRVHLFSDVSWESIILYVLIRCLDRNAFQTFIDGSFTLTIFRCDFLSY